MPDSFSFASQAMKECHGYVRQKDAPESRGFGVFIFANFGRSDMRITAIFCVDYGHDL